MSMYLDFEPHSWYKGFAIKRTQNLTGYVCEHPKHDMVCNNPEGICCSDCEKWQAITDNGNTYQIDTVLADTLKELKQLITKYRSK